MNSSEKKSSSNPGGKRRRATTTYRQRFIKLTDMIYAQNVFESSVPL